MYHTYLDDRLAISCDEGPDYCMPVSVTLYTGLKMNNNRFNRGETITLSSTRSIEYRIIFKISVSIKKSDTDYVVPLCNFSILTFRLLKWITDGCMFEQYNCNFVIEREIYVKDLSSTASTIRYYLFANNSEILLISPA